VKKKEITFTINTLAQAKKIVEEAKIYELIPILHFKSYILIGFGCDFIITLRKMLLSTYGKGSFKLFVDCGFDKSRSIELATEKIDFIKLKGNSTILKKIKNIADKNRVLLNPSFNIVDCRNIKNIKLKFKKLYTREKNEN
tara:strand:+ start:25085 stop:25507 length:423 start_codon:yes stop_codon:yes gene_type:complete